MSVVNDVREVLQDFITPDLKAVQSELASLKDRLDRFERAVDQRFDKMDAGLDKMDSRFDKMDSRFNKMDDRFDEVLRESRKQHEDSMAAMRSVLDFVEVKQRLARLERLLPERPE